FFSGRRRHTRWPRDWSSDVCSSDLSQAQAPSKPLGQPCNLLRGFACTKSLSKLQGCPKGFEGACACDGDEEKQLRTPTKVRTAKIGRASCREREERQAWARPLTQKT